MELSCFCEEKYQRAFYSGRPQHDPYDDFSIRHPKMPLSQRAKIFLPFAALKGFDELVNAKFRHYVEKQKLSEERAELLSNQLSRLHQLTSNGRKAKQNRVLATVTFYEPCDDENHEAYGLLGSYTTITGVVWRVDCLHRILIVADDSINIDDISELDFVEESREEE